MPSNGITNGYDVSKAKCQVMELLMATMYPSDMPPILARQEPRDESLDIYKASLLCLVPYSVFGTLLFGM
jgi:hypothetical protein